ncbi:hypothetical protein Vretimale_18614 [Volvox reticuliferus]|uniref:Uncharacterized protein n=1 Tax=Volvox reticuliferus TaxID=1737510 RepID=A0A8J4GXE2_9CHLO|nr:hypothetical protein Vretifemale_17036 [Volvox reticuliferus]GIM15957.1 hypothetical protein Vretimale_18614 [Volvox reticuliferus]
MHMCSRRLLTHRAPGFIDNRHGAWSNCERRLRRAYRATNTQTNKRLPSSRTHLGGGDVSAAPNGRGGSALANLQENAVATNTEGPVHAWPALQPPFTYFASAEDALSNVPASGLSPLWKLLLLSDGSVTRHLQLLSGSPVSVECLSMRNVGCSLEGLPAGTDLIPGPRVQRQVLLNCQPGSVSKCKALGTECNSNDGGRRTGNGASAELETAVDSGNGDTRSSSNGSICSSPGLPPLPLVYASSWWNAETIDEYLRDKSKPIWVSLSQGHVELYREVHALFRGDNPQLAGLLGCPGPFWGRQYIFWSGGKPLTLIYEVFSPRLEQYLGPAELDAGREGAVDAADVGHVRC